MQESEKMSILIVDDVPANVFALEELIAKDDRILYSANSGPDALKIALSKEPDLIILDVQMPEMDGFEVASILQSNNRTKEIPVIFASAIKKDREYIMKGFEEGAVDYLFKPLDPEITKAKVAVLLKIQRQKKELKEKAIHIKELNDELKKNLSQLVAANKELESFSYSVSHDLRAPLRALNGYSNILQESYGDKLEGPAKEMLANIQESAAKMNRLIDSLLQLSRLGSKDLQKSQLDMGIIIKEILDDIAVNTPHRAHITIGELLPAMGDPELIRQVWTNLISNAIKYSSKKDQPEVEISSVKNETETVYMVSDNGAGFNMKHAERLFAVFQRLHSPSDFEGTGVGLAIVQRVISRHGGRVWAEGKENEGATFYFSLPNE